MSLKLVIIFAALVCFGVAALGIGTGRFSAVGAGLFLYIAAVTFA